MRFGAAVNLSNLGVKHCFGAGCENGTKSMQTLNTKIIINQ